MLAPVLARLDAIPGVTAARVDASGHFFWLLFDGDADREHVTARTRDVLGDASHRLPDAQAKVQLAAQHHGDPWLSAAEVMTLSFVESRILSVRLANELARKTGATPDERDAIAEAIRFELFTVMECVHAEGGRGTTGWIYDAWPRIATAAVERCADSIAPDLRRQIGELLPSLLARRA